MKWLGIPSILKVRRGGAKYRFVIIKFSGGGRGLKTIILYEERFNILKIIRDILKLNLTY